MWNSFPLFPDVTLCWASCCRTGLHFVEISKSPSLAFKSYSSRACLWEVLTTWFLLQSVIFSMSSTLCRPTLFLTDLCPTFQQELRQGRYLTYSETALRKARTSFRAQQLKDFVWSTGKKQQTLRTVQETNREFLVWNGSGQKCQNITWKADTGTNDPTPTDPFQWKFCSHIMLLWINSSEPKIPFAHRCCEKAKYTSTLLGWGQKERLSQKIYSIYLIWSISDAFGKNSEWKASV